MLVTAQKPCRDLVTDKNEEKFKEIFSTRFSGGRYDMVGIWLTWVCLSSSLQTTLILEGVRRLILYLNNDEQSPLHRTPCPANVF